MFVCFIISTMLHVHEVLQSQDLIWGSPQCHEGGRKRIFITILQISSLGFWYPVISPRSQLESIRAGVETEFQTPASQAKWLASVTLSLAREQGLSNSQSQTCCPPQNSMDQGPGYHSLWAKNEFHILKWLLKIKRRWLFHDIKLYGIQIYSINEVSCDHSHTYLHNVWFLSCHSSKIEQLRQGLYVLPTKNIIYLAPFLKKGATPWHRLHPFL